MLLLQHTHFSNYSIVGMLKLQCLCKRRPSVGVMPAAQHASTPSTHCAVCYCCCCFVFVRCDATLLLVQPLVDNCQHRAPCCAALPAANGVLPRCCVALPRQPSAAPALLLEWLLASARSHALAFCRRRYPRPGAVFGRQSQRASSCWCCQWCRLSGKPTPKEIPPAPQVYALLLATTFNNNISSSGSSWRWW